MDYDKYAIEYAEIVTTYSRHGLILERLSRYAKGEAFILSHLMKLGETALPSELGHELGSSSARIASALGALEKKELIVREVDKADRRKIIVSITDKGRQFAEEQQARVIENGVRIFMAMGESDTKEYLRLTKRFLSLSEETLDNIEEEQDND